MQNERWVADRALLRRLIQAHPDWTQKEQDASSDQETVRSS